MNRQQIESGHIVARYLADQLPDAEREAFEAYCHSNPEMFREIEAAARLKAGLARLDEKKELQSVIEGPARPARLAAYRLAAAVAGLLIGGAAIYGAIVGMRMPVMGATVAEVSGKFRDPMPYVQTKAFMLFRDTPEPERIIELPQQPAAIQLRVLPNPPFASYYRASLNSVDDSNTSRLAAVDGLEPDDQMLVTVYVNSQEVRPGRYELVVVPDDSSANSAVASKFTFTFRSQPR